VLPGCVRPNAILDGERLPVDVFSLPFHVAGESMRALRMLWHRGQHGRSPVWSGEAEQALIEGQGSRGPESIQSFNGWRGTRPLPPSLIYYPRSGDELLAW